MEELDLLVVGAGPAGLSAAFKASRAGWTVAVLEASTSPGGHVRTERADDFLLERGPHTLMPSAHHLFLLARQAELEEDLRTTRPEADDRFIARGGRLHAMPTGPWSFLTTGLLSWKARLTLATEPLRTTRGDPGESAADFFRRRFGPEAARVLAGAFVSGVYAGDPEELSAPAAFPLFWGFEQETGSMVRGAMRHGRRRKEILASMDLPHRAGLWSFEGGLGRFTAGLADALPGPIHTDTRVDRLARRAGGWEARSGSHVFRARRLVLATPPGEAAALLEHLHPGMAEDLAAIPMSPVVVVQLGYRSRLPEIPEGFGFLVPREEGIRTLGVLFPSRLFPDRAPEDGDLLAAFVGGRRDQGALDLPDHELEELVRSELKDLTGLSREPAMVDVRRYPTAIPQLVRGHLERMERVEAALVGLPGFRLAGNYLTGVGLKDAVASGVAAADALGAADTPDGTP